ncbi:polysaccharide biosynthesis C-terminal domain-containing protein [Hydrogenimonas cancrithermarum]|uniref:Capsular polysaccharide biosynthesis protein CapF n=1 Tax=Hydrogenimonas cancrithermarum TaxID=2993563 RepID=A0ABM8FMM2_9BACT|nr:NAD-dependent epimerase/dehydratase family protein [Hydrogenimonas cancrithermarum]BDY13532.1 capsular polysaccharide biosynthesis protein CapF [Hydrogenimonas cancrithermarum]
MKVLVTGSGGFIGKNLMERIGRMEGVEALTFEKDDTPETLEKVALEADFIFHLAGVNRPEKPEEFYEGNRDLTRQLVDILARNGKKTPILMSSSIQAERNNDYGKSKREGEEVLKAYAKQNDATVYIYRLPNVFGKWSRPNYNTVIATWCYNIARDIPIQISDENVELSLVYIDDVVGHFVRHLEENGKSGVVYPDISPVYKKSLGEIRDLLQAFKASRETLLVPRVGQGFERALYATYLSFLPTDRFSYELQGHEDERGTFYEFLKTIDSGQFSVSTTAPGITRGNHYHNTKNEKFLVVKGKASIKLRQIHSDEIIEYRASDEKMEVFEMIPGYTHDITNIGDEEMILLIWANETYDPENPDTYFLKV